MFLLLLRWIGIGISLAAPIGPVSILCIRRALHHDLRAGIYFGVSASIASALTALMMAFVSALLLPYKMVLSLIGGLFLIYLGGKTFKTHVAPLQQGAHQKRFSLMADFASTFFLTIANPVVIMAFIGIFAAVGLESIKGVCPLAIMMSGIFIGAMTWWSILSFGVSLLRAKVDRTVLDWVNKISGVIIAAFGILAIASIVRM